MTLEENFESTVKCLNNLICRDSFGENALSKGVPYTKTTRLFKIESPSEITQSWQSGGIARIFSKLGFVVQDPQEASKEREFFKSLIKTIESGSVSIPNDTVKTKEEQSQDHSWRSRDNNTALLTPSLGNSKPPKSKFSNYMPPRKFSPPRTEPSYNVSNTYTERRNNPILPTSKQSLFSTHQQDTRTNAVASRAFPNPNRFPSKSLATKDFCNEKNDCFSEKDSEPANNSNNPFRTAHQQLVINDRAKGIKRALPTGGTNVHVSGLRKTARFDAPSKIQNDEDKKAEEPISDNPEVEEIMQHPSMKNIDPKMVETVLNEVFDAGETDWNDIAGLQGVKNVIKEIIIWPMQRPDIFTGLRGPPKGILLFGPPGTGKTMIGRLIATQSKSAFFNISASSLTSKWIGEGEKMVRTLFAVARVKQPAVIFIDEIDSILTQRSDTEHESSRRLKTEFLIQFDGCGSKSEDRILVIGVTNRPQELDEAARRRLVKRIYIPLPDVDGRTQLVKSLLGKQAHSLNDEDYDQIAELTKGYSGADMATLCQEASYGPIRDVVDIQNICADQVRPMQLKDFIAAIRQVKASVDQSDLVFYEDWDKKFGCHL